MSIHTGEATPRKPSGSSSQSATHSPASSPSNQQSQRKLAAGGASSIFGVAMPGANGINGLNNTWQNDSGFRNNLEGWNSSRPSGESWDVDVIDVARKDMDSQKPNLNMGHETPRQTSYGRLDERPGQRAGRFSPKRYENGLAKEGNASRYPSSTATFGPGAASSYPTLTMQPPNPSSSYDTVSSSTGGVDDLTAALRGMAVEDDQSFSQYNFQVGNALPQSQIRPHAPQVRSPFNGYVQGDYSTYYSPLPPYAAASQTAVYPNVTPAGLHPNSVPDVHRAHFYDYNSQRTGSQYYYPSPQALIYPSAQSPMVTPQLPHASPVMLGDKKRDISVGNYQLQQQLATQNIMYASLRSTPSPHPQAYPRPMDYTTQLPMIMSAAPLGFAPGSQPMYSYSYGPVRTGRRADGAEPMPSLRSPLLEEFRANKTRKWELRDIFGYVVEFSGDQHGSRFIQQKLETATSEEKQVVFDEIVPSNALQLVQDVFGNYVIQKLFEHGTQVQKGLLAGTMEGHILPLSLQMYGCRVVQKAVECVLPDQQAAFVRELDPHVLKCVKDANGNHVIQKLVERVSPERLGFVNSFRGNVYDLATHPYGCRVLQRCLEHLPDEYTQSLFEELHKYTIGLMQDQFGNYVIQFVLEHGRHHDKVAIMSKLRGQLLPMARHKFASNVCEKALVAADAESRRALLEEIYTLKPDGTNPIVTMMKDQYANYVLQRALTVADIDQRDILISKIRPHLMTMRRYSSAYNKHLVSIERLLDKYAPSTEHGHDNPVM